MPELVAGSGVTLSENIAANTLTISAAGGAGGEPVFSVTDYGAVCNGAATDWTNPATVTGTDDHTAVQAAADAAAAAGGGKVYIPAHCICNGAINVDSKHNITFCGPSGSGGGYSVPPPAQLIYTGTGSSPFISAAHTNGFAVKDLGVRYTSSSFTGDLIDLTNTTLGADAAYGLIERCLLAGIGVHSARCLVSLEGAILCSIVDNHFQWASVGIRGAKTGGLYSNAHYVGRNTFDNLPSGAIMNPAQGWSVISNWFEGTDGGSGGMPYAMTSDLAATGFGCGSLAYVGNWHGDATAVSDAWFNLKNMPIAGLQMAGNFFQTASYNTIPAMKFPSQVTGANISGNDISSYIDLASVVHLGVAITGNYYTLDPANLSASAADIVIMGNAVNTGFTPFAATIIRLGHPTELSLGGNGSFSTNYATLKGIKEIDTPAAFTVATLPSPSSAMRKAFVSDSSVAASGNFGAIVAGGGSNIVPVYDDGTNWRIG